MPIKSPAILVAEDNPVDAMLMDTLLQKFYEVDICQHGGLALAMLKEKKYDLLITDITMPVLGGIDLLVVTEALYPDLPVVVVSTIAWQYYGYRQNHPNAKAWVEKPYKPSVLVGMVAGIISENPA
jgi:CheY-like chemotaxis protein